MPTFLSVEGLSKVLQKVKTVFATKTELAALGEDLTAQTDSTKVAKTGDTMTGSLTLNLSAPRIVCKDTRNVKGTAPSANTWNQSYFIFDSTGVAYGGIEQGFLPDRTNRVNMIVYPGTTTNTSSNAQIGVGFDGSGNWFTYAPTPATADSSTKIATTAYVKAQEYITSSGSITGSSGSCTGNAASATKLQTARTINGVSFNGTANITVADSTKVPLSGGNLTGRCKITGNNFGWQVTNGTETIEFMIGSGKVNRGFWDTKLNKWAVYANDSEVILNGRATGTSSDRRIKQDFSQIPDAVLDAWDSVQWKQFRLRREAASDDAPFHTGAVVQDIQESLQKSGVNPEEYALAYREQIPAEEGDRPSEDNPEIMNSEKWYLRYEEAYAIEAAYLRRRCRMLEKSLADALDRISRIESRLEGD